MLSSCAAIEASIIKYLADQMRIRLISQLINGISRVLQKFHKYFKGIEILTCFVSSFPILLAVFVSYLNEALLLLSAGKLAITPLSFINGSSL